MRGPCDLICLTSVFIYAFILSFPPADSSFCRSLALVDRDGTLHAQFNIRLTQPPRHRVLSTDYSDAATLRSQKSTLSKAPRSLFSTSSKDKRKPDKEKK